MKYSTLCSMVAGLALGAMLLPGTALNAKDQVERPFKISGQICFAPFSDVGVATHFGRFVSFDDEGSGGTTGKYIAANGDLVFWEAGPMTSFDPDTHIFTGVNYLRGGTGRFEGATGHYSYTAIPVAGAPLTFDYTGEGTIAY